MMPELVRLYLRSVALGFGLAAVFTGALIGFDVAGIGHLIMGSDIGLVAALMLVVFNGIVFSAVQFGVAVMGMAGQDGPRGGMRDHAELIPIRVEATVRTKRR
jgi:hypothetical protein